MDILGVPALGIHIFMYLFCCGHCFGFISIIITGDDEGGGCDSQSYFVTKAGLERELENPLDLAAEF